MKRPKKRPSLSFSMRACQFSAVVPSRSSMPATSREIAALRAVVGLKFFAREIVAEARQRGGELAIIMQRRGRAAVAQY